MVTETQYIHEDNPNKRLLLILSPGWEPVQPFGLACLKSFLQSKGFYTRVFDLNVMLHKDLFNARGSDKKIKEVLDKGANLIYKQISENNIDAVGFSVYDPSFNNALYLAEKVKLEFGDDIKIIMGGPHISYIGKDIMDFEFVDIAIPREGEIPLLEFMERISSNKKIGYPCYFSRVNCKVKPPSEFRIVENLDSLPYPNFEDIDIHSYPLPAIITSFSRGCTRKCSFCGVPNIYCGYREKSAEYIVNELKTNTDRFDCNLVLVTDALINANPNLLNEVCDKIIKEDFEVYWASEALPDISEKLAIKMYDAGCRFMYLSPETGSQKIADLMRKGVNIGAARKAFENVHSAGITASAWFIFGFPMETRDDTEETFKFIESIDPLAEEIIFSPFGLGINTPIYKNPEKFGIKEIEERKGRMYCYYTPENQEFILKNQIKNFIELWNKYSPEPFPSEGVYKEIIDMVEDRIEPSKDLQFLIGEKYEEVQFLYKGYGQEGEEYSYVDLFKESFKEVFGD